MKTAFVTGITGQDASYLAELLLDKGYEVHGIIRRTSTVSTVRIAHLLDRITMHSADLTDAMSVARVVAEVQPHEFYNLGAMTDVAKSFTEPAATQAVNGQGVVTCLEAIRLFSPHTRFYQASTSEMFGGSPPPQNETTPFKPKSPYAIAKVAAYHTTVLYREAYGLHASNGILFNHESPRRGETFVTRKIAKAAARISLGLQRKLHLGNLNARRDWGYAGDYVEAMWLMLQQDRPDDYVIATGESHSVREFCEAAFEILGLHWENYVEYDPKYERPCEVDALCGDASKARGVLGWKPKTGFRELVGMMVESERMAADTAPTGGRV